MTIGNESAVTLADKDETDKLMSILGPEVNNQTNRATIDAAFARHRLSSQAGGEVDKAVAEQKAEWAKEVDAIRGSDLETRKLRLHRYLRGFSGAYSWTRCTPSGDLHAILAALPTQKAQGDELP